MTSYDEFEKWWDDDKLTQTNPYTEDTPAFWALEGWQASRKQMKKECIEACNKVLEQCKKYNQFKYPEMQENSESGCTDCIEAIEKL